MNRAVLVTGGAGYIGSHAVLELLASGYAPVVLDNLSTGRRAAVPLEVPFYQGEVGDRQIVGEVLNRHEIEAVLHFAGSIIVPESIERPAFYYRNNTADALQLVTTCVEAGVRRFVFSSTAAVYGQPQTKSPVQETAATLPLSPYGTSKLMTEWMLRDISAAHPFFQAVALRYFNVAGADPKGRTGQAGRATTHLIKSAIEAHLGVRPCLEIFGVDYPTRDGTCERDFIHVSDLAAVHVRALAYLENDGQGCAVNCGYGRSTTVFEVVAALETLTGVTLPVVQGPRRPGDAPRVVANVDRMRRLFDWTPKFDRLDLILETSLAWENKLRAERQMR